MNKKNLAVLFAVAMISMCMPAISAIPDKEPTKEEIEKIIEEQKASQSKGWVSIPNRNSNGADESDDIAPELWERYQSGRTFRVKYNTYSTNDFAICDSWYDYYWTDDDNETWNRQTLYRLNNWISPEENYFENNNFQAPKKAYLDMNIEVDIYNDIGDSYDSNGDNNYDEEYMLFWWLG
jgi:hypothetical protein